MSFDEYNDKGLTDEQKRALLSKLTFGGAVIGAVGLIASRYKVCRPDQFLVRTGLGIRDMSVTKKAIRWPFQKATFIEMSPIT